MLNITRHAMIRMNQRGISKDMIELVLDYGRFVKDKVILGKKEIKNLIKKYPNLKNKLLKLLDSKGLIVVLGDNSIITVYKPKRIKFN